MDFSLACTKCSNILTFDNDIIRCNYCKSCWPIIDGIPNFVKTPYYWGEIPQNLMMEVNKAALTSSWRASITNLVHPNYPDIYQYVIDVSRADFSYLIPLPPDSTALDIGSGWGTISTLLARKYRDVISIESVRERIEFLQIRAQQEALNNITPIQASFLEIPLPTESVDLAVVNGVLEWIGVGTDEKSPYELQLDVLRKIHNILKPGGYLYVGIENRYSYAYFLGAKDHSDLAYTSLVPRWLANLMMSRNAQKSRRTDQGAGSYRTYTYAYWGYKNILQKAGFQDVNIYLVFPDYNHPAYMVPASNNYAFSYLLRYMYTGDNPKRKLITKIGSLTAPLGLQKLFSPCFSIFARREFS